MNSYELLQQHPVFHNCSIDDIPMIMEEFQFTTKFLPKHSYLYIAGDEILCLGILCTGRILLEELGENGNYSFLSSIEAMSLFGSSYIGESNHISLVNYKAAMDCNLYLFPLTMLSDIVHTLPACQQFLHNVMLLIAKNNRNLICKLKILSKKTIREKILTFLFLLEGNGSLISLQAYSNSMTKFNAQFQIPFNHSELADYLCVNRSALERELANMKKEGILTFDKNTFFLSDTLF
ncbi:MAG: Crp/Fnr family transcriptional regulator [Eubacteriales bacterium]